MKIIYAPRDGERREFVFRPADLLSPDAELLEESGGSSWDTFEEYGRKFLAGSIRARRAALWLCLRRDNPRMRLSDLIIRADELDVAWEDEELANIRDALTADPDLSDEERDAALAEFEAGGSAGAPGLAEAPVGKDEPAATDTASP